MTRIPQFPEILFAGRYRLVSLLVCIIATLILLGNSANAETRSLKFYFLHTGEKTLVTYYKNGKYLSDGLKKANWALRDWRRNEPTKMDPKLLDLVWQAYKLSGSTQWIHVVSGYRSPGTNEKLRKRGGGQAKNSQHTHGKALDFFLPDVKVGKMREIGLKMGVGGVGYYPTSGSPFVHLDTGSVRHWPRMSRTQLAKVFPKGKTMHIPNDGKPLANYERAVAEYKSRKAGGTSIQLAKVDKKELNFFQRFAARTRADQEDDEQQNTTPAPRTVAVTTTIKSGSSSVPSPTPQLPASDSEFAALPSTDIPIPISAPRNINLNNGAEIVLAELPREPTPEPEPNPQPQPAIAAIKPEDVSLAVTALEIPIPSKRPDVQDKIIVAALPPEEPMAEKPRITPKAKMISFSPSEIEDLRRSVSFQANPEIQAPRPAIEINRTAARPVVNTPPVTRPEPIITAEIMPQSANLPEPIAVPIDDNLGNSSEIPAPTKDPRIVATVATNDSNLQDQSIIVASLQPIEPGVKSTNKISIPAKNPRANDQIEEMTLALADREITANSATAISAIETFTKAPQVEDTGKFAENAFVVPVPTPNPRRSLIKDQLVDQKIIVASLPQISTQKSVTTNATGLRQRTLSLDKYSAPQENQNSIGQYAMAADLTIHDRGTVQAPAYGRNMIRNIPVAVFVEGFRSNLLPGIQQGFSGKAIVFKKFARLRK